MKQVIVILLVLGVPVAFTSKYYLVIAVLYFTVLSAWCYLGVSSRKELSVSSIRTGVLYKYHTTQLGLPCNLAMRL